MFSSHDSQCAVEVNSRGVLMHKRYLWILILCSGFVLVFSSCSVSGVGTIPSGTPDTGNGTPAVIPSPSPTSQAMPTAPTGVFGTFYAYVFQNQLWAAVNGAKPAQATAFNYQGLPDVSWHQPVWSPDNRHLAFIMNARPAGQGGGGCPAPDYSANGALYIMNTTTMQSVRLVVTADKSDPLASSPLNGYWQYVFWEDATHVLAWYNGVIGKTGAGLYRYNLSDGVLTLALPLSSLGVSTLFSPQQNQPLLLSMRYSSGQLYYQVVTQPFTPQSHIVILRHSLLHPQLASERILDAGSEGWCATQQSSPNMRPGWDISPDGEQLVAQLLGADGTSSIQALDVKNAMTTQLFTGLPAPLLARDLVLSWGPDSQTVVAVQARLLSPDGPYSATLANPATMRQYALNAAGPVAWRSDSAAFALQSADIADVTASASIYVFITGETHGRLLLSNARDFVWGT